MKYNDLPLFFPFSLSIETSPLNIINHPTERFKKKKSFCLWGYCMDERIHRLKESFDSFKWNHFYLF